MKIKELKEYLNSLPKELDNFDLVYSRVNILDKSALNWTREDMPINSIIVDQDHEQICMGKWETINTILKISEAKNNYDNQKLDD